MEVTMKEYIILKNTFGEARMDNDNRANRKKVLRDRLDGMKGEISAQIGGLLSNMMGLDPRDVLSDEEINKHLTDAFNKFDEDKSGELGAWEFKQAWFFLGLKGSQEEARSTKPSRRLTPTTQAKLT